MDDIIRSTQLEQHTIINSRQDVDRIRDKATALLKLSLDPTVKELAADLLGVLSWADGMVKHIAEVNFALQTMKTSLMGYDSEIARLKALAKRKARKLTVLKHSEEQK